MGKHVVVGAGPIGSATAALLVDRGEEVVVVTRSGSQVAGATNVTADAAAPGFAELTAGADVIYNCANPPYHRWRSDWPPLAAALLDAAERTGAVLATVSNLYGYGPVAGPLTEDLPLAAPGPKGKVRVRMWQDALAAHEAGRVRATEVRGSDYLCPGPGSHLGDRVMPRLLAGKPVAVLKSADTPHTWTAPADVARLLVTVAADERGWGRAWHVPSNPPRTQREAITDLAREAGVTTRVGEHPSLLIRFLGLFSPVLRELREVAYQFQGPFVMDSSAATGTFGLSPTPWDTLIADQVAHYRAGGR